MSYVDEYFNQLEMKEKIDKRRIYLATDDPKVIADAKDKYPDYEILGDPTVSKTAAVSSRYSDVSLNGIILDIHMLSMSDYLVCTFSSQVRVKSYFFLIQQMSFLYIVILLTSRHLFGMSPFFWHVAILMACLHFVSMSPYSWNNC